jgi:hypothetical protein
VSIGGRSDTPHYLRKSELFWPRSQNYSLLPVSLRCMAIPLIFVQTSSSLGSRVLGDWKRCHCESCLAHSPDVPQVLNLSLLCNSLMERITEGDQLQFDCCHSCCVCDTLQSSRKVCALPIHEHELGAYGKKCSSILSKLGVYSVPHAEDSRRNFRLLLREIFGSRNRASMLSEGLNRLLKGTKKDLRSLLGNLGKV